MNGVSVGNELVNTGKASASQVVAAIVSVLQLIFLLCPLSRSQAVSQEYLLHRLCLATQIQP